MKVFSISYLKNFVIIVLLFLSITNALISRQSSIKFFNQINFKTNLLAVSEITSAESLDRVIKAAENTLVIVDYSTTWCGPCKVAAPKFFDLSEKYPNVIFLKCVGDKTPEAGQLMKREGVRSVPAFHFWKDGSKFDVINGARIDDVENLIKDNINKK